MISYDVRGKAVATHQSRVVGVSEAKPARKKPAGVTADAEPEDELGEARVDVSAPSEEPLKPKPKLRPNATRPKVITADASIAVKELLAKQQQATVTFDNLLREKAQGKAEEWETFQKLFDTAERTLSKLSEDEMSLSVSHFSKLFRANAVSPAMLKSFKKDQGDKYQNNLLIFQEHLLQFVPALATTVDRISNGFSSMFPAVASPEAAAGKRRRKS
jgi:hypothetical protein